MPTNVETLSALVRDLSADTQLVDDVAAAARAQSPEVARLPWSETRRHVAALLSAGFAAFLHSGDPDEEDFSEATHYGAERAALGVPVAGLLSGVHAGRSRILEIAINRGRAAGLPYDVLLQALLRLDRYGAALERHVIDGYRIAERHLNHDRRTDRIRLLRRILLDEEVDGPPDDPARFGLNGGGRYHCVVSDAADPGRVRAMERTYARCGGVLAPVRGRLSGLTPRLPASSPAEPGVLVVTTPAVRLEQAPDAYRLGVTALDAGLASGCTAGVHSVLDLAGETALAAQPMLAHFLSDGLLAPLEADDAFHRDLVSTALAYLDLGQRLDRTAAALHLHPNTVRYRLRRLRELTGFRDSGDSLTVVETMRWWWALRTWLDRAASAGAAGTTSARASGAASVSA